MCCIIEAVTETEPPRIVVNGLTKHFGDVRAVSDLSFTVEPGSVTGFLGPNGAGKTTTLRMILGLARADSGDATIAGRHYVDLADPTRMVGAVLEANSFHPGRTARNHVRIYCTAAGIPASRADEVLALVGLTEAANKRTGGFSLGMRQRLALATALIGNPKVLILDEPANGLDPEGIAWLRTLMRHLAETQGCTVLVSSHVLSEVEQTVDRVVILARGQLIRQGTLEELASGTVGTVVARSPDPDALRAAVASISSDVSTTAEPDGSLRITGATPEQVGRAAWSKNVELHHLVGEQASLEELFLSLTAHATLHAPPTPPPPPAPA